MSLAVAFIVRGFPVLSQTFVINQAAGLIERGHEVSILSLGDRPAAELKQHPSVRQYGLIERTTYIPRPPRGILARWKGLLPALWQGGEPARMWLARTFDPRRQTPLVAASLRSFYEGLPYLSHARADVVHCQFGMLGLVALQLRELGVLDAPIVTSFRGYDASRYIQQHGPNVYADLFRRGEMFLPNCEHFRQRLIDLGCNPARIEIMRSGIDCSRFAAPALNTRPRTQQGVRLVAIGRLVEKKGFTDAIQAVEIARRDRADVTLQVIGDGPLRGDLQSQIDHLGLGEYVRLLGELDQDELIAVLHESDVLVAPSVRAADGDEDAPVNKLKEAMAMGLPVVATRHGGIGELIEDGVSGYLAPERDSAALADRIVRLIGEKPRWPAMGRAGRRRVLEQFDSEPLNDRLVELYEQIIRGSREGPTILPFARPQLQPQPTARGQHTKAA